MNKPNILIQIKEIELEFSNGNFVNLNRYVELVNTRIRNLEQKILLS